MAKGYVYLLEKGDLLKIGYSAQPIKRARALKAQFITSFEGGRKCEAAAHDKFHSYRVVGEWFQDAGEIRQWFRGHPLRTDRPRNFARSAKSSIKLTDDEYEAIAAAAARAGLQVSPFIRAKALEAVRAAGRN